MKNLPNFIPLEEDGCGVICWTNEYWKITTLQEIWVLVDEKSSYGCGSGWGWCNNSEGFGGAYGGCRVAERADLVMNRNYFFLGGGHFILFLPFVAYLV